MKNKTSKDKFEDALLLGKKRKYKEAAELLLEITRESADIPEAYLFLGRSYHSLNRMEEAIHFLEYYLSLVPDSATGNFFLGRSLLSLGFAKSAISHLKKAVKSHPESLHANGFLGIAYLKVGRSDIALTYLTKAAESSTIDTGIYKIYLGTLFVRAISNFKSGDLEMASQMFIFLINSSFNSILPFIYMGMIERQSGNFRKALSFYEKALKISPDDKLLLYRRAVLLYKVGQTSLAIEELKKLDIEPEIDENIYLAYQYHRNKEFNKAVYYANLAIHTDNSNIDLHLLLGEANRELNKLDIAENHYKKAIKMDRTRIEGHYGLALLFWIKENYEAMILELRKIETSDPENTISSYYKTLCICKLKYDTKITIPALQKEIRRNNPDCHLFNALGEEYIRAGFQDLAEKWFVKAVKLNDNFKEAYNNLINIYKENGKTQMLIEAYSNSLRLEKNLDLNIEYIQILYTTKNYSETANEILKILPSLHGNLKLLRFLANSYRFMEKWDKAVVIYKQILLKMPDNETILQSLIYCLDQSGHIEPAIELLNKALVYLKSPSINLKLIKGVLCYKNKQYDEALKIFRNTLNLKPTDWRIYHNIGMIYKSKGIDEFADQFFSRAKEYKK